MDNLREHFEGVQHHVVKAIKKLGIAAMGVDEQDTRHEALEQLAMALECLDLTEDETIKARHRLTVAFGRALGACIDHQLPSEEYAFKSGEEVEDHYARNVEALTHCVRTTLWACARHGVPVGELFADPKGRADYKAICEKVQIEASSKSAASSSSQNQPDECSRKAKFDQTGCVESSRTPKKDRTTVQVKVNNCKMDLDHVLFIVSNAISSHADEAESLVLRAIGELGGCLTCPHELSVDSYEQSMRDALESLAGVQANQKQLIDALDVVHQWKEATESINDIDTSDNDGEETATEAESGSFPSAAKGGAA